MSDLTKLVEVLDEIGIPYEKWDHKDSNFVDIKGTASDKEFTVAFTNENYEYTQ